jgi:hypothetical protein
MKQDLSAILKKADLTPRERALLLIKDAIEKDRTGKEILTPKDKASISTYWKPDTSEEAEIFNKYTEAWRLAGFAELDAQTTYLQAVINIKNILPIRLYIALTPVISNLEFALHTIDPRGFVTSKEAERIKKLQREGWLKEGESLWRVVYGFAYSTIDAETKKVFEQCFGDDIKTEGSILENDAELTELLKAEKLEEIAEGIGKHRFSYLNLEAPIEEILINNYKLKLDLTPDEEENWLYRYDAKHEAINDYAQSKGKTVEELYSETAMEWISEGGLKNDEWTPLGITHPQVIKKWDEHLKKTEAKVEDLIKQGILKTDKDKKGEVIVTGESLYNLPTDYANDYSKHYRQRVDEYTPDVGFVIDEKTGEHLDRDLIILDDEHRLSMLKAGWDIGRKALEQLQLTKVVGEKQIGDKPTVIELREYAQLIITVQRRKFKESYAKLLAMLDLYEKLSKVFEVDVSYKIKDWVTDLQTEATEFNKAMDSLLEGSGWGRRKSMKRKEKAFKENYYIDFENAKIPDGDDFIKTYEQNFEAVLGKGFWEKYEE